MATPQRLQSQVSTDAAPQTPRPIGNSMNFPDISYDAEPGHRISGQSRPPDSSNYMDELSQSSQMVIEKTLARAEDKIKGLSISLESEADSSYSSMELFSSMPSSNWEEDLKQFEKFMPLDIKIGYFDALILYAEEDREEAEKFRQHLMKDIDIGDDGPVQALLYDCPDLTTLSQSQIGHLSLAVERSTYVFMFLTKHFVRDKWMEFSSESCLMTAIYDPDKKWCVVPVYTEKRNRCTFKIPMGLNSLKGINYYNNDEFYKKGVARLISDKVQQRIDLNENHKTKKKQWVETYKRTQMELREKQKRVEHVEEAKTMEMMRWLKTETERLIQAGIIPSIHHSFSEGQLSTPNHSLPHVQSISSMKDVHSQNPHVQAYFESLCRQNREAMGAYTRDQIAAIQSVYGQQQPVPTPTSDPRSWLPVHGHNGSLSGSTRPSSSVHRDNADSTYHTDQPDSVLFQMQTNQGIQAVRIPKSLSDKIESCSPEEKNNYVKSFLSAVEVNSTKPSEADISQFQHIQTKEQMLNSYSPSSMTGFQHPQVQHQSIHQNGGPLSHAPPLSMSLNETGYQSNQALSQHTPGNQPYFDALLSHSSINQSFTGGNLPNSGLFQSLEEDCGSFKANETLLPSMSRSADKGKSLHSNLKGGQEEPEDQSTKETFDKKKKKTHKSKAEKHVHYTINVYNANAVQVGNQNMAQSTGNVEPVPDDSSEDETESLPDEITEQTQKKMKTLDTAQSTVILKKDPAEGDSDDQGTRGETADHQQPTRGSYNMDAALSSIGSQPIINSHMEQPESKVTKPKVIEDEKTNRFTDLTTTSQKEAFEKANEKAAFKVTANEMSDKLETTNQLPEGLEKLLNLETSVSIDKSSSKYKVIPENKSKGDISNQCEQNPEGGFKRQDSKLKSETNPVVAVISPMRPKLPSEGGGNTELKQVVPNEETGTKTVIPVSVQTGSTSTNTNQIPAQLLTKSATHHDTDNSNAETDRSVNTPPEGASAFSVPAHREVFSTQRQLNPTELFYPNRGGISHVQYGIDVLSTSGNQGGGSEGFTPGTGPFGDDLEYDMCDSDSFDGNVSGTSNNSGRSTQRMKVKGEEKCVIS